MALIRTLNVSVAQSPSPDVTKYFIYVEEAPTKVTYDSTRFEVLKPATSSAKVVFDLTSLMPAGTSGDFNIGIAPANAFGNVGDMVLGGPVPLDMTAPDPCPAPILWEIV